MNTATDTPSPHDLEAEKAVLGAILIRAECFSEVVDVLCADDFFRHAHGLIFRAINKAGTVGDRLSDRSVANIVKAYAERAGFDPTAFAGHSLRSGFLTSAAGRGASIFKMMDVSRHKSVDTLRAYIRDAELFKDHAGAGLL